MQTDGRRYDSAGAHGKGNARHRAECQRREVQHKPHPSDREHQEADRRQDPRRDVDPVFQMLIDRANELGMTLSWGTKGFSVRTPDAEGKLVTILYAYPPETYGRAYPLVWAYGTQANDEGITANILGQLLPLPQATTGTKLI